MMKTRRICTSPQLEMEFEKKPMPALQDPFQVCEEILVKPRKIQQAAPWSETEWSVQRPHRSRRVIVCAWRNKKDCRRSICALIGSSSSCDRAPHGVLPVLGLLLPTKLRDGFPGAPPRLSARRWLAHRARRDVGCPAAFAYGTRSRLPDDGDSHPAVRGCFPRPGTRTPVGAECTWLSLAASMHRLS